MYPHCSIMKMLLQSLDLHVTLLGLAGLLLCLMQRVSSCMYLQPHSRLHSKLNCFGCHIPHVRLSNSHAWLLNLSLSLNTLTDEAVYRRHEISSVMSDFRQCPWEIGSAPAERAWQGEVGGCTRRVQTAWRCLGLALKSPWLEPSGPLLSSFAQMG